MFQRIQFSVKPAVYPTTIAIFTNKRASFRGYRRTYILHKDINSQAIFRNLELLEMEQVN